jgi:hypothetical protein
MQKRLYDHFGSVYRQKDTRLWVDKQFHLVSFRGLVTRPPVCHPDFYITVALNARGFV